MLNKFSLQFFVWFLQKLPINTQPIIWALPHFEYLNLHSKIIKQYHISKCLRLLFVWHLYTLQNIDWISIYTLRGLLRVGAMGTRHPRFFLSNKSAPMSAHPIFWDLSTRGIHNLKIITRPLYISHSNGHFLPYLSVSQLSKINKFVRGTGLNFSPKLPSLKFTWVGKLKNRIG